MKDSVTINNSKSDIVIQLDSLRNQVKSDFNKLNTTIEISNKEDSILKFVSNDALFTTITTILVFTLGIIANIISKKIGNLKRQKETRDFVKHHLDNIVNSYCIRLAEEYQKISVETNIDNGVSLTPPKILSNNFERILKIDSKELFNSVKIKAALSNILSQIDFLNSLRTEVQQYHNAALSSSDKIREKLNDKINYYLKSIIVFIEYEKQINSNYTESEPYVRLNNSIMHFYNSLAGKRALKKFYDEILKPNQDYLVDKKIYRTHKYADEIINIGKNIYLDFAELNQITNEFKEQYNEFSNLIKHSQDSLNENISKINWR